MKTYQITSQAGMFVGHYQGSSREEAIEALYRDAGYKSGNELAEVLGKDLKTLYKEWSVEEV